MEQVGDVIVVTTIDVVHAFSLNQVPSLIVYDLSAEHLERHKNPSTENPNFKRQKDPSMSILTWRDKRFLS